MSQDLEYSAALTGASFLFYELKTIVKLSLEHLSNKEIRDKVIEDNLFEYKHVSSLKRALPTLLRRKEALDGTLMNMMLNENLETAKLINLYSIMKTDRLFFEWMLEVVSEKLREGDLSIEKKDINMFFSHKAEQNEKVASFKEQTTRKLQTVHQRILFEAGILSDMKTGALAIPLVDIDLKEHIQSSYGKEYIQAMGA